MTSTTLTLNSELRASASRNIALAAEHLLSLRQPDGHWCALLTADTTLESDYILLQLWLHAPDAEGVWNPPNKSQIARAADRILSRQLPDGGFNIYVDGPSEVSASAKAYFALKLAGIPVESSQMTSLRERILELGGLQAANSYTKVNLSLFGLTRANTPPASRPKSCCFPASFSTRCRRGPAPLSSRSPSSTRTTQNVPCPPASISMRS